MPFKSRAQWRWCYATGQSFCRRWAHETGPKKQGYRRLPSRAPKVKKSPKRG